VTLRQVTRAHLPPTLVLMSSATRTQSSVIRCRLFATPFLISELIFTCYYLKYNSQPTQTFLYLFLLWEIQVHVQDKHWFLTSVPSRNQTIRPSLSLIETNLKVMCSRLRNRAFCIWTQFKWKGIFFLGLHFCRWFPWELSGCRLHNEINAICPAQWISFDEN